MTNGVRTTGLDADDLKTPQHGVKPVIQCQTSYTLASPRLYRLGFVYLDIISNRRNAVDLSDFLSFFGLQLLLTLLLTIRSIFSC